MEFDDLVNGKDYPFFGVDGNTFKIEGMVFEALEDEDDGYRSYMNSIEVKDPSGLIFYRSPISFVKIVKIETDSFAGYRFIDSFDEHCWLEVGTRDWDDFYPYFIFKYEAKDPNKSGA